MAVIINGKDLTIELVDWVVHGAQVEVAPEALELVERSALAVQRLVNEGRSVYGITTGFGYFKNRAIGKEDLKTLQKNIVMSHAMGMGEPLSKTVVRAMMLIRVNTLALGYSGIRPATLLGLVELLNHGVHPVVPSKGSLGASGDLAPLSHIALVLIGMGRAEFKGEEMDGAEALKKAGLSPLELEAKEGLALTNGTAQMTAIGALAVLAAENLTQTADVAGCLSLEALGGTEKAFDARIHALRPHPRQVECAANLRRLLGGSEFTRTSDPEHVQDVYSLRCMPQVHGAVRDAIAYGRWAVEIELNSVTDNPLIFLDGDRVEALSGGNFHGEPIALALDFLAFALTDLGNISERRLAQLVDWRSNEGVLPPFLIEDGGLNSGFMLTQYSAAALAAENKVLSHPASADSIPSSANVEDHVSMGATAAMKLLTVVDNISGILALEVFAACQGLDIRLRRAEGHLRGGAGTSSAYLAVREVIPFIEKDVVMTPFVAEIQGLIREGKLV